MLDYLDENYSLLKENEEKPIFAEYTDFERHFDKVEHSFLVSKLSSFGIGGSLIELLKSYLQSRKQRVRIRIELSNWLDVTSGVPQGYIMGGLVFFCFINDLPSDLKSNCFDYAESYKLLSKNSKHLKTDINHLSK